MMTFPMMFGPFASCPSGSPFSRMDPRYMHIPVRKSLGWPTSIQKPYFRTKKKKKCKFT